jgi:hypothetical protein
VVPPLLILGRDASGDVATPTSGVDILPTLALTQHIPGWAEGAILPPAGKCCSDLPLFHAGGENDRRPPHAPPSLLMRPPEALLRMPAMASMNWWLSVFAVGRNGGPIYALLILRWVCSRARPGSPRSIARMPDWPFPSGKSFRIRKFWADL